MKKRTKRILAMLLASAMILQQGSTVGVLATETEPVSETVAETTAAETMAQETQAPETTAETKAPETQATETALGTTQTETAAAEQTETAAPQIEQTETPAATEATEATETAAETTGSTEQSETMSQETTAQETTETSAQTEEKTDTAEETATEKATEAATETEAPKTNFTYEDSRVIITAVAEAAANLPQDAQIHADYMAPGTAAYNEAAAALEAAYAGQDVVLDYVFYDIYFTAASAGDGRIEPEAGTVTVSMQFKKAELTPDEDVEVQSYDVVHVENGKAQEVPSTVQTTGDGSVASVGFTSGDFSPYGFVTVGQEPVKTIGADVPMTIGVDVDTDLNITGNTVTVTVTDSEGKAITEENPLGRDEAFKLHLQYEISNANKPNSKDVKLKYQFPNGINLSSGQHGYIEDKGANVGEYNIDENGLLTFYFYDDFLEKNSDIQGYVDLQFKVDKSVAQDDKNIELRFPGVAESITVYLEDGDVTGSKTYTQNADGTITFTITLTADASVTDVVLTDVLGDNFAFVSGSFYLGSEKIENVMIEGQKATIKIDKLTEGTHTITYKVTVKDGASTDDAKQKNTVSWTWNGEEDAHTTDTSVDMTKKWLSKNGWQDGTDKTLLDWQIDVNTGFRGNLKGKTITDTIGENHKLVENSIQIKDEEGNIYTQATVDKTAHSFTVTFPDEEDNFGKYTITYQTEITGSNGVGNTTYTNTTSIPGDGPDPETSSKDVTVKTAPDIFSKEVTSSSQEDMTAEWEAVIDVEKLAETSGISSVVFEDELEEGYRGNIFVEDSLKVKYEDGTDVPIGEYDITWESNSKVKITFHNSLTGNVHITYQTKHSTDNLQKGQPHDFKNNAKLNYNYSGEDYTENVQDKWTFLYNQTIYKSAQDNLEWDETLKKYVITWDIYANAQKPEQESGDVDLGEDVIQVTDVLPEGLKYVSGSSVVTVRQDWNHKKYENANIEPSISGDGKTLTYNLGSVGKAIILISFKTTIETPPEPGQSLTYKNSVSWKKQDGDTLGSTTADKTVKQTVLDKKASNYDTSGSALAQITYTVKVNEFASNLVSGDTLTLHDVLQENVTLLTGGVHIVDGNTSKEIPSARVSYDSDTRELRFVIPDEQYVIITYQVRPQGKPGEEFHVNNEIVLVGTDNFKSSTDTYYKVQESTAGASGVNGGIVLQKIDADEISKSLSGAVFELYRIDYSGNNSNIRYETDDEGNPVATLIDTQTTNSEGQLTFQKDGSGKLSSDTLYYYVEKTPPTGYEPNPAKIYFVLRGNAYDTVKNAIDNQLKIKLNTFADGATINVTNKKSTDSSLIVNKTDGTSPLAEAGFTLYTDEGCTTGAGITGTPNETGTSFTFSGLQLGQTYYLKETKVPDGYKGDVSVYQVVVGSDGSVSVYKGTVNEGGTVSYGTDAVTTNGSLTVANTALGSLKLKKVVSITDASANGRTYTFIVKNKDTNKYYDKDGNESDAPQDISLTTGDNGSVELTISNIPAGNYEVTEKCDGTAIEGYRLSVTGEGSVNVVKAEAGAGPTEKVITNTYTKKTGADLVLKGTKTLLNGVLQEAIALNDYTFEIEQIKIRSEEQVFTGKKEAKSQPDGTFGFECISFTKAGIYTFTVTEKEDAEKADSITYDSNTYTVFVTVEDVTDTVTGAVTGVKITDVTCTDASGTSTSLKPDQNDVCELPKQKNAADEDVATFVNRKKLGSLSVTKAVVGTEPAAGEGKTVSYKVTVSTTDTSVDLTKSTVTVKIGGRDVAATRATSSISFNIEKNQTVMIDGLPVGNYTVTEETEGKTFTATYKVGTGTETSTPAQVEVKKDETPGVTITNTYTSEMSAKLTLTGKKTFEGHKLIAGEFKFQIVEVDETGEPIKDGYSNTATNDADGKISFPEMSYDEACTKYYQVSEVVPAGEDADAKIIYDKTVYEVKVTVELNTAGTDLEATSEITKPAKAEGLNFKNDSTTVKVDKIDEAGNKLSGAKLQITEKATKTDTPIDSWTTGSATHDVTGKLEVGKTYVLEETDVPAGYAVAPQVEFTIDADGNVLVAGKKVAGNLIQMTDAKLHFNVNKTELGTGDEVEGAELTVYEKQADGTLKKVEGASWTSKKGETHDFGEKLEAGRTYVLREEVAPDGYGYVTDIEFTVEKDGKVTTTMPKTKDAAGNDTYLVEDTRIRLEVDKRATGTGEELDGAVLELLDAAGNVVESWTSKKGETHNFGGKLKAGESYTLRETIAPDGYTCVTDMKFTVGKDGTVNGLDSIKTTDANGNTVYVVEDTLNKVSIQKVDESGAALAGAKLVIKDADGKAVASWTTDGKAHEITGLATGKYTLSEVEAPEGYQVSKDVPFEITGKEAVGGVIELSMTDTKVPNSNKYSLTVTKHLHLDGITGDLAAKEATYYVALFSDEAKTQRVSNVKKIEFKNATSSTVTFDKLAAGTYYVGETDENGTLLVSKIVNDKLIFHPEYTDGGKVELEGKKTEGTAEFTNVYMELPSGFYLSGQITVTKKVLVNGAEGTSDETYYARVFSDKKLSTPASDVLALDLAGGTSASVTVTDLSIGESIDSSMNYYVAETDENGKPLDPDAVTEFKISIDKSEVVLSANNSAQEVVITNNFVEEETETETETETEVEKKEAPKTSDDTDFMRYLLLMALSAGTCAIAFEEKRRRNRARK